MVGIAKMHAQIEPSNVYLFDITQTSDTTFEFTNPRYLTNYNPRGYNNQPAFLNETELYITSQEPGNSQTDLYLLDMLSETKYKITETPEGEFSPNLMPTRYQFSAVRQEIVGRDTIQRLWEFPVDRLSDGKPIFKYLNNIGYYHWINSTKVAVFLVGNPNKLAIADTRTDEVEEIAENAGRCFKMLRNGNLAYVQKSEFDNWYIVERKMSTYSRSRRPQSLGGNAIEQQIIETLPGSEDFEVLPNGTYIMALGSKLFKFNPRRGDQDWREIADLRYFGLRNITRMTLSRGGQIAIVAK